MVVIGVGNLLMGDDGFGIHVVKTITERETFGHIDVVDAMTNTAMVLEAMDGRSKAIIVDAISYRDSEPGDVHTFRFDPNTDPFPSDVMLSMHDMHFKDAIAMSTDAYDLPDEVVIVGAEPNVVEPTMELSQACKTAIPTVIDIVQNECNQ